MTARSAVDLPEPDSPTSPTTSFGESVRLSSLTAGRSTPPTAKLTERFLISTSASDIRQRAPEVQTVAQALAHEVEADHRGADGERGTEQRPERYADVLLRLVDHDAPIGVGRLGTQAEIAQGSSAHEREADIDAALDDDGRPDIGQDLPVLDVERAFATCLRRRDVVVARGIEHGTAHDTHELWRCRHAQGEDGLRETRADSDDDEQGEDESGNGEERVDEAHDDLVEAAAVEAG